MKKEEYTRTCRRCDEYFKSKTRNTGGESLVS